MYGPVLSSVVAYDNQDMIDAACAKVGSIPSGESYYSRSWLVISSMTLNGAVAKAGSLFNGGDSPTPTASPVTQAPVTASPVSQAPVSAAPVTASPVTQAPVTAAPVTASPVTQAPVTASPVSQPPVSAAPVTASPVTQAPVTASPVTQAPVTAAPVTASPVTQAPVTAPPSMPPPTNPAPTSQTPDYYCDWGNGYEQPGNDYCHSSKEHCEGNCNGFFVDPNNSYSPPNTNCIAEWQACTNNHNGCCGGLTCYVQNQWYAQCKK